MEYRLLIIGLIFLAYALLTKTIIKKNLTQKPKFSALWSGVFTGLCLSVIAFVVVTNMEDRRTAASVYEVSTNHIIILIITFTAGWLWGFLTKLRKSTADVKNLLKQNLDWAQVIAGALLIASFIMYGFVQAFKIPSASMRSTFKEGDHLFVNKLIYGIKVPFTKTKLLELRDISRRDVVIFRFPSDSPDEFHCGGTQYGKDFIKRVVGLPGETIEIKEGIVLVDGVKLDESPYVQYTDINRIPFPEKGIIDPEEYLKIWQNRKLGFKYSELLRDTFGPVKVPADSYFVLGDNRDHSCDSRFWGAVPGSNIKGKAWFVYWPPTRIGGAY